MYLVLSFDMKGWRGCIVHVCMKSESVHAITPRYMFQFNRSRELCHVYSYLTCTLLTRSTPFYVPKGSFSSPSSRFQNRIPCRQDLVPSDLIATQNFNNPSRVAAVPRI